MQYACGRDYSGGYCYAANRISRRGLLALYRRDEYPLCHCGLPDLRRARPRTGPAAGSDRPADRRPAWPPLGLGTYSFEPTRGPLPRALARSVVFASLTEAALSELLLDFADLPAQQLHAVFDHLDAL